MTNKKGSGDVIGELEITEDISIKLVDDGDPDTYVYAAIEHAGIPSRKTTGIISIPERDNDEEQFVKDVKEAMESGTQTNIFLS